MTSSRDQFLFSADKRIAIMANREARYTSCGGYFTKVSLLDLVFLKQHSYLHNYVHSLRRITSAIVSRLCHRL